MQTIIFDWKGTLYDSPNKILLPGALEIVIFLEQKNIQLVLIGKGNQDMLDEAKRLGVTDYFTQIIFRNRPKDISLFETFIDKEKPEETIIVGDRINSEIAIGNQLRATTIWIKQGKFATEAPVNDIQKPTFTVTSLYELKTLLSKNYLLR